MAFSVITQRTKFTVADNCKKTDSKKLLKVVSEVSSFMVNPVVWIYPWFVTDYVTIGKIKVWSE